MFAKYFKEKICSKNGSERSVVQYIIELPKKLSFINLVFMFFVVERKTQLKHKPERKVMDLHPKFCWQFIKQCKQENAHVLLLQSYS